MKKEQQEREKLEILEILEKEQQEKEKEILETLELLKLGKTINEDLKLEETESLGSCEISVDISEKPEKEIEKKLDIIAENDELSHEKEMSGRSDDE